MGHRSIQTHKDSSFNVRHPRSTGIVRTPAAPESAKDGESRHIIVPSKRLESHTRRIHQQGTILDQPQPPTKQDTFQHSPLRNDSRQIRLKDRSYQEQADQPRGLKDRNAPPHSTAGRVNA